ncbi:MAG: hypothetical protein COB46_13045 [Rhodospirillaceae bacterium]|nr:MAG: hypothetical protein COB46_13045 [Rhodospirillaceae bacterium]
MKLDLPDNIPDILDLIRRVFEYRLDECGPVSGGVMWKDADQQILRLEILLSAILPKDLNASISINDFGCGYGALFELISDDPMMTTGRYIGYDISGDMVNAAKAKYPDPRATFIHSPVATEPADYSFVSGTYNMDMGAPKDLWSHYVKTSLKSLWDKTNKVMAFNMLDDIEPKKLADLYYANKAEFIDFAKTLSPDVEINYDYPLNEFTIILRRIHNFEQ